MKKHYNSEGITDAEIAAEMVKIDNEIIKAINELDFFKKYELSDLINNNDAEIKVLEKSFV